MKGVQNATSTLNALTSDHTKYKSRVDNRHDAMSKTGVNNAEQIKKLQQQVDTLVKNVSKGITKQGSSRLDIDGSGNNSKKKNKDDDAPSNKELQNMLETEVNGIHDELNDFNEQLKQIKIQTRKAAQ